MDGVGVEVNLALDAVRLSRCCVEAGTCTRHGDAPHLARFVLGLVQLLLIVFRFRFASCSRRFIGQREIHATLCGFLLLSAQLVRPTSEAGHIEEA